MKEQMLVTVYILIYKDMSRLQELLQSVADQTYENIELLISDDGSPNMTQEELIEAVKPYIDRYSNIIINKNEQNLGTVRHINGIIPKANGKILCGIAGDDRFFDSKVIEEVVRFFADNESIDIVTSKRFDEGTATEQPIKKMQSILKNDFEAYRKVMFRATPSISGAGTFFRKELFEQYGNFPEEFKLVEDASYFTKLIAQGVRFGFLDRITIRHGAGGVSDKKAVPNLLFVKDMDYLYSDWLYSLIPENDKFSKRCVKYHGKRRRAKGLFSIAKLYLCYLDVCIWLLGFYREEIFKRLR